MSRRANAHEAAHCIISSARINTVEITAEVVCVLTVRRLISVLSACGALWACGDNMSDPPDAATTGPFVPAPHAPMPSVLRHNGTVIANLRLVTLAFEGYDAAALNHFGDAIVGSSWYTTVGAEYGIRPGSHTPTVSVGPAPSSLTRDEIMALIKQQLTDGHVPRPNPGNTQLLYMIFVPSSVALGPDLEGVLAYHDMATFGGAPFPFVAVLDDGSGPAEMSVAAGQQLINAVTNPYDFPNDGYYADPPTEDPWSLVKREVADLCERELPITEGILTLPQVYSDIAARAGRSPCKPSGPDAAWSDVSAEPSSMRMVPRGSSVEFMLTGWSTEEVPAWELRTRVADFSQFSEDEMQPVLSDNIINNNMMVKLTLHVPLTAPSGAPGGVYVLSGENGHPWAVGFVVR
jgi:hypothetical protein